MIEERLLSVLQQIHQRLTDRDILWVLTGSLAFALQGVECTIHDIDLQTDRAGAYAIAAAFPQHIVRPVHFAETERIRSHFGVLEIDDVSVEIMGDVEKRLPDGAWQPAPDLRALRRWVPLGALPVPVLPLAYEAAAYRTLGRIEKADRLEQAIPARVLTRTSRGRRCAPGC